MTKTLFEFWSYRWDAVVLFDSATFFDHPTIGRLVYFFLSPFRDDLETKKPIPTRYHDTLFIPTQEKF